MKLTGSLLSLGDIVWERLALIKTIKHVILKYDKYDKKEI